MQDENRSNRSEHSTTDAHLTLSEAAKIAPGRPSTNCLWRWCRKGVLSRSGERVRLDHVRMGGKLFTTARSVEEFGRRLAEADKAYFSLHEKEAQHPTSQQPRRSHRSEKARFERLQQVEDELAKEGI